jgi:NADPH2:quinone reductase
VKALVCRELGPIDALRVEELPDPTPAAGKVVLEVKAASVNFPDALMVQGKYQARPELPFVPGFECAGVITALGPGTDAPEIGTRVVGMTAHGAFAEQIALPASAIVPIGESLSFATAAAIPMTYGTAYHALKDRAQLAAGETLLVLGAGGGIGTAAVELGKLMGARVIAAASSPEKLDAARRLGADETILYTRDDWRAELKALTGRDGVDVVCDPVGGEFAEPALRSTGWGGRYLVVGFAAGDIPRLPWNLPLLKGSSIVGVFWGEFRHREPEKSTGELRWLLGQASANRIAPTISASYPLSAGARALEAVYERQVIGKVVIEP